MKNLFLLFTLLTLTSLFSQNIPMQNGNFTVCSGTFSDSGGNGNYANDENFTITFCPVTPGDKVRLDFTSFSTQQNADILTIYDGPNTSANAFGQYSGVETGFIATATPGNTSGCLTLVFTSNVSATGAGWLANVSCYTPCQDIVSVIDATVPSAEADGIIKVCRSEMINFQGSGTFTVNAAGATYNWDFGDGTTGTGTNVSHAYAAAGVYIVNLNITDYNNCNNNNLLNQIVQVSTTPNFTGTSANDNTICLNDTAILTGVVNAVTFNTDCTTPVSGTTFLPDGSGTSYETSVTVDCYDSSQTITSGAQITNVCINMEHSYLGDLDIILHSPNGDSIVLKAFSQGGGGTYLGGANDDGSLTPGTGATYCFTTSSTVLLVNGSTITAGSNPPGNSIRPGNYMPFESFNGLIGSPVNGNWTIEIVDNLSIDNGYIFWWSIDFDNSLLPANYSFTPVITNTGWVPSPDIINAAGNVITVQPTSVGTHTYTYFAEDNFGCTYTHNVPVTVYPLPVLNIPPDLFSCDNLDDGNNQNGIIQTFNLNAQTPIILGGQTGMTVQYYTTLPLAEAGVAGTQITSAASYTNAVAYDQTIYFRIENNTTHCYEVGSFQLHVYNMPTLNTAPNIDVCDNFDDGNNQNGFYQAFDLDAQTPIIIGGQANMTVTYYTSNPAAQAGIVGTEISNTSNYSNSVAYTQTIYFRIENNTSHCFEVGSFDLHVFDTPTLNIPANIEVCDNLDDGNNQNGFIQTFNLDAQTPFILGGQSGVNVTYYTNQTDADAGVPGTEITTTANYSNTVAYDQTIYFRIENTTTHCYAVGSFHLIVTGIPNITIPTDQIYCDNYVQSPDNNPNNGIINGLDFNSLNAGIIGSQTNVTVSYYENLLDAENGTNPITFPYENVLPFYQEIFIRLEENLTGCFSVSSFNLYINPLPAILNDADGDGNVFNDFAVTEYGLCEDTVIDGFTMFYLLTKETEILDGEVGMNVSYYTTQSSALSNNFALNAALPYINSTNPQTIYVRVENPTTGCVDYTQFELRVYENPIANTPPDIALCDDDADGVMAFDLASQTPTILGTQTLMTVTYHLSQADADNGVNPLSSPYQNDPLNSATQIFVRMENGTSGCIDTTDFWLIVHPLPILYPINDFELCDDNADGYMLFDLTQMTPLILNGQTGINVTYHYTQLQAENNQAPITTPIQNPVANGDQEIFYKLTNTTTSCAEYGSFFIRVHQIPFTNPITPLEVCDDLTHDGFTQVYLDEKDNEIRSNQTGTSVYYYATANDAQNAQNQLPIPYTNTTNPQTIHYALVNNATGCAAYGQFTLEVLASMNINPPTSLQVCDPDSDGYHHFNLHLKDSEIAGALVGQVNVTYHETLTDAQLGVTDIPDFSNYDNIQAWNQIIYVRVENLTTGCFDTTTLELIVNPTPQINFEPEPFVHCDDNYDGHLQVNLNDHLPEILGTIQATDVQVSYYHSQAEAWAEVNPIVNYLAYYTLINPETIWVRVEYALTNCASVAPFEIIINPLPTTITPTPLSMCDNDDDGEDNNGYVQTFDLHTKDQEILNGQIGSVTYHYTQVEAETNTNAIASPFTNAVPHVQTLWVRITLATGCYALTTMDVRVEPLPTPLEPNPLEACDTDADGYAEFDLTDPQMWFEVQQGEIGTTLTFHETEMDAHNDVNALPNNYTNISTQDQSQIIYVRDTYTATGCYRIVPLLLVAQPSPQLQTPDDLQTCDDTTAIPVGQSSFTLTDAIAQTLGDIDPTTVTVTFHINQNDANSGSFPIDTTQAYNNLANHQEIWIRVEDNQTGCYNVTSFHLEVNPLPVVPNPVPSMTQCDDDTDGQNQFYLDTMNAGIVGAQTGLAVYYFETLAQAQANDPTTWLISPYTNQINPQTLHVRVENLNTGCYSLTTMDLRVIPMPNITDQPQEYHECDSTSGTDTDGQGLFDLTTLNPTITNNQSDVTVVYYYDQALVNSINTPNNFQNTSNPQTVYALVTSNLNGCTGVVTINLIVDPQPIANPPADTYICSTTIPNQYLANLHTDLDHLVVNDPTGLTITYHATSAQAQANTAPLNNNLLVSNGTQLWVRLTTPGGCWTVGGPYTIRFATLPIINPYTIPQAICDADGNGSEVFDLTAVGTQIIGTQANVTATYYQLQGTTQTAITTPGAYIANVGTTTIVIDLENTVTQCTNTTQFTIEVYPKPSVTIQASSDMYCINEQAVNLTAIPTPSEDATHTYTYQWMLGTTAVGTTSTIAVSQGGTYQVTITNANGCIATATHQVEASQQSTMQLEDLDLTYWQNANTLTIPTETPYGIGDYVYSIDGGTPTTQTTYTNLMGGTHTLEIIDLNGCLTQTITFTILDYMRFFTPNGDGYNDTWNLLGGNTQPGAQINIFDRYGKLIAQVDPTGEGWNGLYNGFQMPSTDYWFTIELTDGTIKKGHFSLVRR